jgi:hypothetical protein
MKNGENPRRVPAVQDSMVDYLFLGEVTAPIAGGGAGETGLELYIFIDLEGDDLWGMATALAFAVGICIVPVGARGACFGCSSCILMARVNSQ